MKSLILQIAARFLKPLLLLFSIFLLLRGHNEPGGGFSGGLVAASAFALHAIAYDVETTRRILGVAPQILIAAGLFAALCSGLVAMFIGQPFLTGNWIAFSIPMFGAIELGTPFLFDVGVYLVVLGVALIIIFSLIEA